MKTSVISVLMGIAAPLVASESTPLPYAEHCAILYRAATRVQGGGDHAILDTLQRIALGKTQDIAAEAEVEFGVKGGTFGSEGFDAPQVRACALRSIGKLSSAAAREFLANVKPSDLGEDLSQVVWPAAQIALREAELNILTDSAAKTEFLERAMTERHDPVSNSAVHRWAIDELCDRGAQMSLPVIQKAIRDANPGRRAEEDIEFCEARIRVLSSNPDRVKALGSTLTATGVMDNLGVRLVGWAVRELASSGLSGADALLDRFASEIDALPHDAPARVALVPSRLAIQRFQLQRKQ